MEEETFSEIEIKKFEKEIADTLFPILVNTLYQNGDIKESDLDNKEIVYQKVFENFIKNPDFTILPVVDHRSTIIVAAENYEKENPELSYTLYATYIEHSLNLLIQLACVKKGIEQKTISEIIRSVNIKGKSTWLFKLLELPSINSKHLGTINKISEIRNSFIHYKWKHDDETNTRNSEEFKKVRNLIKYMKTLETKYEYQGKKKVIHKASSKIKNNR